MPDINFNCSKCGAEINAEGYSAGSIVQCPNCNSTVMIPMPGIKPGMKVAGYEIVRRLGAGGMGEVWLANQTTMERKIALKILSPALTSSAEFIDRFLKEVKNTAKLEHTNIITAFDAGVDNGIYFLSMSFVDGVVLDDKLRYEGKISEKEALRILRNIADALRYAWNKFKILHRDIKPANIILNSEGVPKLMDMGISKSLFEEKSLTMTGIIVGTPHYMSPEQARADTSIDCRSDIYSLGTTLYHLVTGSVPYDATTAMGILMKHITDPFPPPQEKNPELSEECAVLLEIMMAKIPDDRQQTWEEAIRDIDLVLSGHFPSTARPSAGKSTVMQKPPKQNINRIKFIEKTYLPEDDPDKTVITQNNQTPNENEKKERQWTSSQFPLLIGIGLCILIILGVGLLITTKKGKSLIKNPETDVEKEHDKALNSNVEQVKTQDVAAPAPAVPTDGTRTEMLIKTAIDELKKKNPAALKKMKVEYKKDGNGWGLDLVGDENLTDISPLNGLPLNFLKLSNCYKLSDIGAIKGMPLIGLTLVDMNSVSDISSIKGMSLNSLVLSATAISDVSIIRGMPITVLGFWKSPVSDISAIKGMQLTILNLGGSKVADISGIKGMPLERLDLYDCQNLKDLSPLADCKTLKYLSIPEQCKDIEFLRKLPKLELLNTKLTWESRRTPAEFWKDWDAKNVSVKPASNQVPPTASTAIEDAKGEQMIRNAVEELKKKNPAAANEMKTNIQKGLKGGWTLSINNSKELTDISPLQGLPLIYLGFSKCQKLSDISPIKGMPLTAFTLNETNSVSDISALTGLSINSLTLTSTSISDISALKGMPLNAVGFYNSPVTDIGALKDMQLTTLILSGTKVADISVLKGMPLENLELADCKNLNDLSPIAECRQLKRLSIPVQCKNIEFLRKLPNLEILDTKRTHESKRTPAEFWRDFDLKRTGN